MYTFLLTNAGKRGKLIKNIKESIGQECRVIVTDNWSVAPALFLADQCYLTSKVSSENYIEEVLDICKKENVNAITSLIDPEIMILAKHKEIFIKNGILPLFPSEESAKLCFDKYEMYKYLVKNNIPTVLTFDNLEEFIEAKNVGKIDFPVFIKPRSGSGSVGASKVEDIKTLENLAKVCPNYIIQECMPTKDIDIDVYIDTISKEIISIFSKNKIETKIGGTSKSVSFKDKKLFDFVKYILNFFDFSGPIDIEVFKKDNQYYLSEINPRFSGAYLHAYGANVDFFKYILNNIKNIKNTPEIGNYEEGVLMLMYDEVVITKVSELKGDYND